MNFQVKDFQSAMCILFEPSSKSFSIMNSCL